jgi:hypothetical protein
MVYPEISAFIRKHAAKGSSGSATARAQAISKKASVKKVASKKPVAKKATAKKHA